MGCTEKSGGEIARWTTPTITYKPSQVEMADITDIKMTIRQNGQVVLEKGMEAAQIDENGFAWLLSQEETGLLTQTLLLTVQVDYKTEGGLRYTTVPKTFNVVGSAINEVF